MIPTVHENLRKEETEEDMIEIMEDMKKEREVEETKVAEDMNEEKTTLEEMGEKTEATTEEVEVNILEEGLAVKINMKDLKDIVTDVEVSVSLKRNLRVIL